MIDKCRSCDALSDGCKGIIRGDYRHDVCVKRYDQIRSVYPKTKPKVNYAYEIASRQRLLDQYLQKVKELKGAIAKLRRPSHEPT